MNNFKWVEQNDITTFAVAHYFHLDAPNYLFIFSNSFRKKGGELEGLT